MLIMLSLASCNSYADIFPVSSSSEPALTNTVEPDESVYVPEITPTIAPTSTAIPYHQLGFINLSDHNSNLRVRTGPDTTYDYIGGICHGLTVRIFTEIDGWYEIEFDGETAYCSKDYIIIDNDLSEPLRPQYCINIAGITKKANREIPDGESYSIGDSVDITGDGISDGVAVDTDKDKSADSVEIQTQDDLIDITYYSPDIFHNIDLATEENQFDKKIYTSYNVLLQREVYEALRKAQDKFKEDGYYIKIYDAYRPLRYQETLYNLCGDTKFFNNTTTGSNHNRGAALDMTLVDSTGEEIEMPSKMHDFSQNAHRDNPDVSTEAAANLDYMTSVMLNCGFSTYAYEWWHFNYINAKNYELSDYQDLEMVKIRKK